MIVPISSLNVHQYKLSFPILFILLSCSFVPANAQDNPENEILNNAIYVDFGLGPLLAATVNYERVLKINESSSLQLRGRTGFLWGGVFYTESDFLGVPINVTALWGKGKGHFELTGGLALGVWRDHGNPKNPGVFPLVDVGYRYESPRSGFIFRVKIGTGGLGIGLGIGF